MMLMQNDPFREMDSVFSRMGLRGNERMAMPMDAYRRGSEVWVHIDLPGVKKDSLDVTVERNVLTVSAERRWEPVEGDQTYLAERSHGSYRRQVHLGEGLDGNNVEATYDEGVLTLRIPVAEAAQPRKIEISGSQSAIEA